MLVNLNFQDFYMIAIAITLCIFGYLATSTRFSENTRRRFKHYCIVMIFVCSAIQCFIFYTQMKIATIKDERSDTPLIVAVQNGNIDTIKELIENNEDVNAQNNYGFTALFYAVRNGNTEMVEYLISRGANINISNTNKVTPLMEAVFNGRKYIIEILIANGADVNLEDSDRDTVLNYAELFRKKNKLISDSNTSIFTNNTKVEYILIDNLYDDIVKILLKAGAIKNKKIK